MPRRREREAVRQTAESNKLVFPRGVTIQSGVEWGEEGMRVEGKRRENENEPGGETKGRNKTRTLSAYVTAFYQQSLCPRLRELIPFDIQEAQIDATQSPP